MIEGLGMKSVEPQSMVQGYLLTSEGDPSPPEQLSRNHFRRFGRSALATTVMATIGIFWGAPTAKDTLTLNPSSSPNCLVDCPIESLPSPNLAINPLETTTIPSLPAKPPVSTPLTVAPLRPQVTTTTLGVSRAASSSSAYLEANLGVDISWPPSNCTVPIPQEVTLGIVGVTGGKAFTPNPCLAQETTKFKGRQLELYINGDYQSGPALQTYQDSRIAKFKTCDSATPDFMKCVAEDYGYNNGQYAVQQADKNGVSASVWWIDVETGNSWDGNTSGHSVSENISSLTGTMEAIEKYASETAKTPVVIGFYSVPGTMWNKITGGWQAPDARNIDNPKTHAPNWVSKAIGSLAEAEAACRGNDFTGGGTRLVQYQTDPSIDRDVSC